MPYNITSESRAKVTRIASETPEIAKQKEALEFPLKNLTLRRENVRSGDLPDMTELKNSIAKEGVLEPLIAAPSYDDTGNLVDGKYELIAGYRRYWAAKQLGLKTVPVRLIAADEDRRHRVALIENLQRADMNPLDKAKGIKRLMDQEGIEQKDAAAALGVSQGFISQHLALLKLPAPVQGALEQGRIDLSTARTLCRVRDEDTMVSMLEEVTEKQLNNTDLSIKVEHLLAKNRKDLAETSTSERAARTVGKAPAEKESLSELYAKATLAPLKKHDLLATLQYYANKLDAASSETKRAEYKYILKGLEIAGGLKPAPVANKE